MKNNELKFISISKNIIFCLMILAYQIGFAQIKNKKSKTTAKPISTVPLITTSSPTERLQAFENRKKLDKIGLANGLNFTSIGPSVMSGRVADLEVNPSDPKEFYVAYAAGGLWHTVNNGLSFAPIFDNQAVITLGAIAVDWNANPRIIYAGTGEANASRSSYAGLGIFKSNDNGKTWQNLGLTDSHHIAKIEINPADSQKILVAAVGHLYTDNAERGIFYTENGGATWQKTLYVDDKSGGIDVSFSPQNPNIVFAGIWQKDRKAWNFMESGLGTGLYKSQDAGKTWQKISGAGSGFPQGATNGRVGLAVVNDQELYAIVDNQQKQTADTTLKKGNRLTLKLLKEMSKETFLATENKQINTLLDENRFPKKYTAKVLKEAVSSNKYLPKDIAEFTGNANDDLLTPNIKGAELYKSNDGGATWSITHNEPLEYLFSTYGYYFGTVHVAPGDPSRVVIPSYQIVKSDDGGKTFAGMNAANVHADHHALWINPKDKKHMILGNDGGINITYDDGEHWFFANTPSLAMIYALQVDNAKPYNVYCGLQDNGVWYGPNNYKADIGWQSSGQYPYKQIMGGDGMQVAVDTRDNKIVYTGFQFGNYYKLDLQDLDNAKPLIFPQEMGEVKNRFNWQSPILLSKFNQDIVYFGGNRLFKSVDKGQNFVAISQDLTLGKKEGNVAYGTITTIDESALRMGLLYIGTDDGQVQMSADGGYSFQNVSTGLPKSLWVSRVTASISDTNTVWVSLNGYRNDDFNAYLYKSEDRGKTWEKIGDNLPNESINVVKQDPKNHQMLYVGTDHGLYVSMDKGKNFWGMNQGLPNAPIHDLIVHPTENDLIIGTHGRGIYKVNIALLQSLNEGTLVKNGYIFKIEDTKYNKNWGKRGIYDDYYNKPVEPKANIYFYVKETGNYNINVTLPSGITITKNDVNANQGINKFELSLLVNENLVDFEQFANRNKTFGEQVYKINSSKNEKIYLQAGDYKVKLFKNDQFLAEETLKITENQKPKGRSDD